MRLRRAAGSACLFLALSACSLMTPDKDADALARRFIGEVASGADLSKDPAVDPQLAGAAWQTQREGLMGLFPKPMPDSVKTTGWSLNAKAGEGARAELRFKYLYGKTPVVLTTVLRKPEGKTAWIATGLTGARDAGPVTLGEPARASAGGVD
ncbi:MAG TPA: hypothetical protein VG407_02150 [Caulobacteraceae bacterium]|jgi:hypothetical protein|nr:hypothetical protein [Caulobacteraceae bacterium]